MICLLTEADRQLVLEYLGRNEIETSFLYGNIIEFGIDNNKDIGRCADYYGYLVGGTLRGILPFYNLGSCIPHYEVEDAVPSFSELMKERKFNFLLGMQKIIKPLYEQIKMYKEVQSYDESSYFINRDFKPFVLDGVKFADANGESSDEIIDFIVGARINGFKETADREEIRKSLTQRGIEEDFIIAEKDGKIVAQAGVQTYTPSIIQIGSVYTIQEERGKGYCKAVVSELCRRIIDRGKMPTLMVHKDNTPAVMAYSALGFEQYDDYLIIRLGQDER